MKPSFAWALLVVGVLLASCSSVPTFSRSELPTTVTVVESGDFLVLEPSAVPPKSVGLVFYPGGLVKPEAYALALAGVAAAGYPVVIVKMPFDLAFFDAEKGLRSLGAVPTVKKWVIGGHSLGGVAATMAVGKHPEAFAGIVFLASYPAQDNSLAASPLPALSVAASNDGLATPEKVAAASGFLPPHTVKVVIQGGNHAQFADYGPQKGDGTATLPRSQQQTETRAALLEFLATF